MNFTFEKLKRDRKYEWFGCCSVGFVRYLWSTLFRSSASEYSRLYEECLIELFVCRKASPVQRPGRLLRVISLHHENDSVRDRCYN